MKAKTIVLAFLATFGLAALATADKPEGKKYQVSFHEAVKVGSTELRAGEYHLVLGSPKVHFIHINSGDEFEIEATIHTADKKFSTTAIGTTQVDGAKKLSSIELGGSTTRVAFP